MTDSVKMIFKTLIKVPIIIFVFYLIFNLLMFTFTFFKALGFSYVVMQTAVENNYIPSEERTQLENYLNSNFSTGLVTNVKLTYNDSGDPSYIAGIESATKKRQYGSVVRVGVYYEYTWIWPLMPKEQLVAGDEFKGISGSDTGEYLDSASLEAKRQSRHIGIPVKIAYTVPGLKYYPDLTNY